MEAWINYRKEENGPMVRECVAVKENPLAWQKSDLSYTATGYGRKIPTRYMVQYMGKWRRVYCCIFSNIGTLYIGNLSSEPVTVRIDN